MNTHLQTRVRQPLGLIEVIDRSEAAIELYPDMQFVQDELGILWRADSGVSGSPQYGGGYSLFTRVWLGLAPPTANEPGYCSVVGEVFETGIPLADAMQARIRPVWLLDEVHDYILPRLLRNVANLKDIYCPYVDRADVAANPRRHDPHYQLLIWPQDELMEDVNRLHNGITCYPLEEDLNDSQCRQRWPWFKSRDHTIPAVFPPYKEDKERLYGVVNALQSERTEDGSEMFGVNKTYCERWLNTPWQTPHMAVAMVCAAFQRWDWVERINVDAIHDGYPIPTEEEDREEYLKAMEEDEEMAAILYSCSGHAERSAIEAAGMDGYRRLLGLPARETPWGDSGPDRGGDEAEEGYGVVVPV